MVLHVHAQANAGRNARSVWVCTHSQSIAYRCHFWSCRSRWESLRLVRESLCSPSDTDIIHNYRTFWYSKSKFTLVPVCQCVLACITDTPYRYYNKRRQWSIRWDYSTQGSKCLHLSFPTSRSSSRLKFAKSKDDRSWSQSICERRASISSSIVATIFFQK